MFEHQAVDGDATDVFDVTPCHRLAVGNDGQGFECGTGVARGFLGVQAVQVVAHFRAALEPPATGDLHQLHTTLRPLLLQVLQQGLDGVGTEFILKQHPQFTHRQRLLRTDQGGFEDACGIRRIHGLWFRDKARQR